MLNTHMDFSKRTRFYSDCAAVFQGGGCRAVAFAGAYEVAHSRGIRFSRVAGTSSGSIAASLIAAGADPPFVLQKLGTINFQAFLQKPTRTIFANPPRLLPLLRFATRSHWAARNILEAVRNGGLYSSEPIERWVEDCLRELLPGKHSPIEFRDLPIPLYVIAGNLDKASAQVWSKDATPQASVAHAVRASCSIPLYFQPLEEGSTFLVDGAVVSNTPLFVFTARGNDRPSRSTDRILLFMLEGDEYRERAEGLYELLKRILSLAVDGTTKLQLDFAPHAAQITINTGTLRATDFHLMSEENVKKLIESGRVAVGNFLDQEGVSTRSSAWESTFAYDEHEALLNITSLAHSVVSEVIVSSPNTKWFWELFPTFYHWRLGNKIVKWIVPHTIGDSEETRKELQRRKLMKGLGIAVYEDNQPPFYGFLVDPSQGGNAAALLFSIEPSDYDPVARFYSGKVDEIVVAAISKLVKLRGQTPKNRSALDIVPAPKEELLKRLKSNVSVYRHPGATLDIEEVNVSSIQLVSRYVRAFRFRQIDLLIELYAKAGIQLFAPAQIPLIGGGFSIVTPPVLEQSGDSYVALEGNTRLLYCLNKGLSKIRCVVVKGVSTELPGVPIPLKHVRITDRKRSPEERIEGFDHTLFRDIERAVRPLT